jgi:Holliday junction resolvase
MRHIYLVSKSYRKGYSLERHCCLTLEFNGFHVKRNNLSIGIEDVIAFNKTYCWLIQCKNTKRKEKSMTKDELTILKKHASELGALPVYLYKEGNGKYVWINVSTGFDIDFLKPFDKMWYRERMKKREELRKMKKKNLTEYNKYVLKNWESVHRYIC